ncbi:MAG: nucleoside-triphosphatase [Desulfobacterales bacterium]|jgi:nucleoside-triphosphatase
MGEKVKESEKLGMAKTNLLITGLPGSGKTTVFRRLVDKLRHLDPAGFFTAEIRKDGGREGFGLASLDGRTGTLAHVDFRTGYQVGKYGVDVAGFEAFIEPLPVLASETGLVMIDEIGKMECLSARFTKIINDVLNSDKPLIATIAQKGGGLIADLKKRSDVQLFHLTHENQEETVGRICAIMSKME